MRIKVILFRIFRNISSERNFKEAKRLKEDSEALKAEGIESQEKLERLLEELNQDTLLLQTKEKEFEKIKEELEEIEHESGRNAEQHFYRKPRN